MSKCDPGFREIVGRHLHGHIIADQNPDIFNPHFAAKVCVNLHSILEFNPEGHVWEELFDGAFELKGIFFGHAYIKS